MKSDVCVAEHLGVFAMIYEGSKINNQDMEAWHRYLQTFDERHTSRFTPEEPNFPVQLLNYPGGKIDIDYRQRSVEEMNSDLARSSTFAAYASRSFHGRKSVSVWMLGHLPVNVMARSSMLTWAGGLHVGNSRPTGSPLLSAFQP